MKIRGRGSNSAKGNKHLISIYKTGLDQSGMDKGSNEAASVIRAGLYTYFLTLFNISKKHLGSILRHDFTRRAGTSISPSTIAPQLLRQPNDIS